MLDTKEQKKTKLENPYYQIIMCPSAWMKGPGTRSCLRVNVSSREAIDCRFCGDGAYKSKSLTFWWRECVVSVWSFPTPSKIFGRLKVPLSLEGCEIIWNPAEVQRWKYPGESLAQDCWCNGRYLVLIHITCLWRQGAHRERRVLRERGSEVVKRAFVNSLLIFEQCLVYSDQTEWKRV